MYAELLLAMLGNESQATDAERARALAGASLFAEALHDLRQIRRLLSPAKEK